jgi:hypothetical protein
MRPPTKTMTDSPRRSPEPCAVQRAGARALQSKAVKVEKLSGYLFRHYRLNTSKDFFYILKCRPSNGVRLLRHEDDRLDSEACVLQALSRRPGLLSARLIEYESTTIPIGSKYIISGPFSGAVLASVEASLSRQAIADIDRSLGQYVRGLSTITNPDFGPIRHTQCLGSQAWSKIFALLLEVVLRDAEDALINLPYEGMRQLVRRHFPSLDKVTQPRLVLLELSADENVLIDEQRNRVTGVLDFSTAIWGDPFMSDCFYRPTASFVEGFGKLPNGDTDERVRQYLYVCATFLASTNKANMTPDTCSTTPYSQLSATTIVHRQTATSSPRAEI